MLSLRLAVPVRVFGDDLRAAVTGSRLAGFEGVQLDAVTRAVDLTGLSQSGFREVRHVLASQNQPAVSMRAEIGADGLGPRGDVDRVLDRTDGVLRAAAALAVPVVCLDLGRLPPALEKTVTTPKVTPAMAGLLILPEPAADPADDPEPPALAPPADPKLVAHWHRAMAALADIADRYGVPVALSSALSSLAALAAVVRAVDCPWFGVDFDTANVLRDAWTPDAAFEHLGPLVRHVRARDAVVGEAGRTKPAVLGRGDVAWRTMLENLDAAGYHAAVTIDPTDLPDPKAAAVAGLKQLRVIMAS